MQNATSIPTPTEMSRRSELIGNILNDAQHWLLDAVRGLVPRYEDAEDIVQDVFQQFTGAFDQIRSLESSSAWLYRAARNRVSDFYRKRARTLEGDLKQIGAAAEEDAFLIEEIIADPHSNPERDFDLEVLEDRLEAAIEALPENQRDVFIWHEIEGLSFNEIAEITGESKNTLLSRKRYAILALRNMLKDIYE